MVQPADRKNEQSDRFALWFSRNRKNMIFLAGRIVSGSDKAELAVQNCWNKVSPHPPIFDTEGAFRSWISRIVIQEALALAHESTLARAQ